jgi:hypothetical protein
MRRYSPVQMKTGGKLFGWWKQGFSFAKRCLLNIRVIWDVTLFWLVNSYRRFERSCCLHFRGRVVALLRLLEPEDDGNKTFRNVGNYLQINKAKHPGRPRYSRRKYFGLLDLRERERERESSENSLVENRVLLSSYRRSKNVTLLGGEFSILVETCNRNAICLQV